MSKRAIVVLMGMSLALAVATVWVPVEPMTHPLFQDPWLDGPRYAWIWRIHGENMDFRLSFRGALPGTLEAPGRIYWPALVAELALILLLGGGLLAWLIRRDRRRADAVSSA